MLFLRNVIHATALLRKMGHEAEKRKSLSAAAEDASHVERVTIAVESNEPLGRNTNLIFVSGKRRYVCKIVSACSAW